MQDIVPEKKRIGLLIEKYSHSSDRLGQLKTLCNELLKKLGQDSVDGFQNYFYKIRNFIFHRYRDFPDSAVDMLDDIVNETVEILPSILSDYKYPQTSHKP